MKNPYIILGISINSTYSDIKNAYTKIALKNHPDKIANLSEEEKKNCINKFREATEAYQYLTNQSKNNFDYEDFYDNFNWKDYLYEMINDKNNIELVNNIASFLINNNFINRGSKGPIKHKLVLYVTLDELYSNTKKKIRLILKKLKKTIYLSLNCMDIYPYYNKIYIDDDGIEHDIDINFKIEKNESYTYRAKNNKINLYYNVKSNIYRYLNGFVAEIDYFNNEKIKIYIPKYINNKYCLKNKGINGGNLTINIYYDNRVNLVKYKLLNKNEKNRFNKILNEIIL
jgi:DnaJ-class molecular chaperone